MTGKIERDHWHPGFLGAMELEFIDYKDELIFEGEHQLSKEPLKMDLLIIKKKKTQSFVIKSEIFLDNIMCLSSNPPEMV